MQNNHTRAHFTKCISSSAFRKATILVTKIKIAEHYRTIFYHHQIVSYMNMIIFLKERFHICLDQWFRTLDSSQTT